MGVVFTDLGVTRGISSATVVLAIAAANVRAALPIQLTAAQSERLDSRIGPANLERYKSIRNPRDWENPFLVIDRGGIDVIAKALPSGRTTVARAELQRTLIALPIAAWPYGRVVALQDTGHVNADGSDTEPIAANREAALATLNTLQVTVERWPSG